MAGETRSGIMLSILFGGKILLFGKNTAATELIYCNTNRSKNIDSLLSGKTLSGIFGKHILEIF